MLYDLSMDNNTVDFHRLARALAFTLMALFMYIPALLYPFMLMRYAGLYKYTTIWDGIRSLFNEGSWVTASIVFLASIIIPIFKLAALLFIIVAHMLQVAPVARNSLLVFIEYIGRWSMLDIFLVAIMVALVKFGAFADVSAESASYLLGGVVISTMLASATLAKGIRNRGHERAD